MGRASSRKGGGEGAKKERPVWKERKTILRDVGHITSRARTESGPYKGRSERGENWERDIIIEEGACILNSRSRAENFREGQGQVQGEYGKLESLDDQGVAMAVTMGGKAIGAYEGSNNQPRNMEKLPQKIRDPCRTVVSRYRAG